MLDPDATADNVHVYQVIPVNDTGGTVQPYLLPDPFNITSTTHLLSSFRTQCWLHLMTSNNAVQTAGKEILLTNSLT